VSRGELLALIDNKTVDAGVLRARTQVEQLESQLQDLEGLLKQGAVSSSEVDTVKWQLRSARDSLRETSATADQARLLAPFDGVVAIRDIRVGEAASAGKRAFQVVDLSMLRVNASLPERDVGRVRLDQPATLTAAYDDALQAKARVTRLSPVIDANTGTFQVMLTVDPGEHALRPGQYVRVGLEVDRREGVLVVPREAVVYDNGRPIVFRVKDAPPEEEEKKEEGEEGEDQGGGWLAALFGGGEPEEEEDAEEAPEDAGPRLVAERVPIKIGLADTVQVEIVDGLAQGDAVVVVGQANLKDGGRVRLPKVGGEAESDGAGAAAGTPAPASGAQASGGAAEATGGG
jgi:multidrug efflux pump subunit AcrA (membrane-fusion protein)